MGRLSPATFGLARSRAPAWKLRGRGLATDTIAKRMISVTVAQHSGMQSDQLSMVVDDRPDLPGPREIAVPQVGRDGQELEVLLGTTGHLASVGRYRVDQVTLSGSASGRIMTITGVPRLMISETTQTWADKPLADVVATIARRNQLTPKTSRQFAGAAYTVDLEHQVRESDLAFLTRLAERYDGMVKPMAGHLLFLKRGESTTAGGAALTPVALDGHDVISWSCTRTDRTAYDGVIATWHELDTATQHQVHAGKAEGDAVYWLRHTFRDADEAEVAAHAKLDELTRSTSALQLTTLGNPLLIAEKTITVRGLRTGVDGRWMVDQVTHSLDATGYTCQLTATGRH